MSSPVKKPALGGLTVREAMRMQVVGFPGSSSIDTGVRSLIKHKINALLIRDSDESALGVVSKTDVMGAYYASLPIESPLEQIMISPPLFCGPDDSLESALHVMRSRKVYRLYVSGDSSGKAVGILAYPDIVGLLYGYCRSCEQSIVNRRALKLTDDGSLRFRVKEVMTPAVTSFSEDDSLLEIMEGLSVNRFGAVLITDGAGTPSGVISKTDLILAYKHGISADVPARTIVTRAPVRSCDQEDFIEDAIRTMIFSEVHRLFVHRGNPANIVGVFSLSDAARVRSGSCHACVGSRIRIEGPVSS